MVWGKKHNVPSAQFGLNFSTHIYDTTLSTNISCPASLHITTIKEPKDNVKKTDLEGLDFSIHWHKLHLSGLDAHIIYKLDLGLQPSGLGSVVVTYRTDCMCLLLHQFRI